MGAGFDCGMVRDVLAIHQSHMTWHGSGKGGARLTALAVMFGVALAASPAEAGVKGEPHESRPQIRLGVAHHDLNGYGGSEAGEDFVIELRSRPLSGAVWEQLFSPRLHVGANVNTGGRTSSLYAGLTWVVNLNARAYASIDLGGAVHDGKLKSDDPERAELGSRLLFREAVEVGVRFGRRWRLGIRLDHISNANLASENDGITDIGLIFSHAL